MDNVGAEVGQKMRSAIKAKLMELGCYVDDELPDYIMVMVANKRTKSQMNQDLQLFLATKTSPFVDWLQVVLKKLKEITVTNPEIYKRVSKRKVEEPTKMDVKIKKEKKNKKKSKNKDQDVSQSKSITDDIPVEARKLSEMRKIIVTQDNLTSNVLSEVVDEDSFDIPPLSEVAVSNESELAEIEEKIKNVKSRLGMQVTSDFEDDDFINLKAEPEDLFSNEKRGSILSREDGKIQLIRLDARAEDKEISDSSLKHKNEHPRIIFGNDGTPKKQSVLSRLGKRNSFERREVPSPNKKTNLTKSSRNEEAQILLGGKTREDIRTESDYPKERESALKRLGVMSKVAVPSKEPLQLGAELIVKDVPSVVKVTPRLLPPSSKQANKNLLLKAVAEAQRSIAQTPVVGTNLKPDALFTKKYREKNQQSSRKRSLKGKASTKKKADDRRVLDSSSDDDLEYIPKPVKRIRQSDEPLEYVPSFRDEENSLATGSQTFIITLDGIDKSVKLTSLETMATLDTKKRKSPIVFKKLTASSQATKKVVPEKLPIVGYGAIKTKERCKYWPTCRQGEKCEFVHPNTPCKSFPQCKFGDNCLYVHPMCKFESSCTRKDCPYNHTSRMFKLATTATPQKCKFFPNCTNVNCMFYHPRVCKYGKYCKNRSDCSFLHESNSKNSFTWRPTIQP